MSQIMGAQVKSGVAIVDCQCVAASAMAINKPPALLENLDKSQRLSRRRIQSREKWASSHQPNFSCTFHSRRFFSGCWPTFIPAFTNYDNGNGKVGLEEMSPEELGGLRKVFDMFDANRDGFLSLEELCAYMKKLSGPTTKPGLLKIIKSCDWNNDGRLDFKEFVALTQILQHGDRSNSSARGRGGVVQRQGEQSDDSNSDDDPKADMKEAFKVFDKDGNGLISPIELRETLCDLGLLSSSSCLSRIHSMIKRVDTDGDGHVSFSEFETMMGGK
ncbi:hypothetical protein L7F22_001633 [Adiantum nelumboides]|nr:hypothetical protein [Adiantum nelumboides]